MKTQKSSTRTARIGCPLFSSCTHNLSFHPSVWFPSVSADLSLRRPSLCTKPRSPWRPSSDTRRRRRSFSSDQNTPTLTRTHSLTPPANISRVTCVTWSCRKNLFLMDESLRLFKKYRHLWPHSDSLYISQLTSKWVRFHMAKTIRACGVVEFFFYLMFP